MIVNIVHGAAHNTLRVELGPVGIMFVYVVILIAPLCAMVLTWTKNKRIGFALFTFSMAASFVFGLYNHFVSPGIDNVAHQPHETWGAIFILTAWLLLLTEAAGAIYGMACLLRFREVRPKSV